ncbi:MAG: N-acyl-D-amino-acid deacylase family protein, partial [Vicinamibacteraceae bacterium]
MSTRRRRVLWATLTAAVLLGGTAHSLQAQRERYDVILRGGHVVDGTGNPWFAADVGIRGDRIAAVGRLENATAGRVIDASGLVVAPGFIDLHTHSDEPLVADGNAESKVRQGVTIDVLGEGSTVAPGDGLADARWRTFTDYFEVLKRQGTSINVISHVSSEQVRRVVLGYETRPATPAELDRMKQLVARAMEEGAWGVVGRFESGGPRYPEEVLALARVAAAYGGNYATHHGSEGYEQDKEIAFALRVAEEVKMPVHIFHLKIRGEDLWPRLRSNVARIQAARDRGLDVTANQYPYTAMQHGWSACFPLWMREGGPARFAERLKQAATDTALREKVKNDPEFIAWSKEHGWWEGIVLAAASTPATRKYEGMSVAQIAKQRGDQDPADTLIMLMAQERGDIRGIFHNQSEENVDLVLRQPWVAPASDGSALNLDVPGFPHPRSYGTNVRILGRYVRERSVLTLEDAVRKMSSLPAQILGLRDRGQIREGFAADVVVFDAATVGDTSSFEKPKSYAKGVLYTLVNGVP